MTADKKGVPIEVQELAHFAAATFGYGIPVVVANDERMRDGLKIVGDLNRSEITSEHQRQCSTNTRPTRREAPATAHSTHTATLPWQRSGWFFAITVVASFVLNEIWEMAQMSAYVETAGYSWASTLGRCTRAAVGDVSIILGIYLTGALIFRDPGWSLGGRWNMYATVAILGLAYAVLEEDAGLAAGSWSYTGSMPMVPVLGVGLWPLLQMTLLTPLVFMLAKWWVTRSSVEKS